MFRNPIREDAELRILFPYDAEMVFALVDRNRAHLRHWLPWVDATVTPADTRSFIQHSLRRMADGDGFDAGIWCQGTLAGVIGIFGILREGHSGEIGYWLSQDQTGKGLVTDACRAIINHAFAEYRLHRVVIRAATENISSRAVAERLGFTHEGTLREALGVGEQFQDMEVYSLLRQEWEAWPPQGRKNVHFA